jgi:hypothetical protein
VVSGNCLWGNARSVVRGLGKDKGKAVNGERQYVLRDEARDITIVVCSDRELTAEELADARRELFASRQIKPKGRYKIARFSRDGQSDFSPGESWR